MKDLLIYIAAAFFEIFGCFAFWNYFKLNKTSFWLLFGSFSLVIFAFLLTKVQSEFAGRAYAIYGGIYIVSSLFWLYFAEHQTADKWDIVGAGVCIIGVFIILFVPR
ncbi:MAG: hypothetical protein COZ18_13935 [Flexibacter sp. CG_4_10_14_3_um_filter_32_15]|nr:MAG: hypothetical protein COZ18_13935 [Flexibacter sp. CG_4_10_14_3_um_filter_32_15]